MSEDNGMQKLTTKTVWKAGGLGILAAVVTVVITRIILGFFITLASDFQPFGYGALIFFTVFFTVIGVLVLAIVNRFARDTLRTYNIVAVIAFFISLVPDILGAANPSATPMGGESAFYLILIIFHVVAAIAYLLTVNYVAKKG